MDKRIVVHLDAKRKVSGVLRGFDAFMNMVLDDTIEESSSAKPDLGLVCIRGNTIQLIEPLERVQQ